MSTDSDPHRPSFRFRDKISRFKDRVKDKIKDKAIRHNVTLFVHQNLTSDDVHDSYTQPPRHGVRQRFHHYKDVLKNKTHYESLKDKIKHKIDDKFDIHDNKTYPKGFYDSLFSPETENDVYLQTALICLWVIALLCIIPTIVVIFLPAKKKKATTTSTNMIFFHIFLCELCYLTYVLLAMINVAKDFRLASLFCDLANYGMYVTIPIMQFALLFLSLERLTKHFNLSMTWIKIFTKPYLTQVILCVIWIILIALLVTFMFIKKQFSFNFIKDKAYSLAPPIVGDVVSKLASRRHHCSIDGRLSSVFKTLIIILFIILIIKPILFSLGFNLLTPFCCRKKRKNLQKQDERQKQDDRHTTRLVTIFLLLNLFFSLPFYFVSMFNSVLTRIDSTKDTFTIVLKICFILRIVNIIFECLAFYIFERNSWNLLRKLFYYGTCKKCPMFKAVSDDDLMYTKDPAVQDVINRIRLPSDHEKDDDDEDDDVEEETTTKKKQKITKKREVASDNESEEEADDDDGGFRKVKKKPSITVEEETSDENDDDEDPKLVTKQTKRTKKKVTKSDEDEEEDDEPKRKPHAKRQENDDEEDESKPIITTTKRKSQTKKPASDEEEEEEMITKTKRKSTTKKPANDDDDDEEEEERQTTKITKRISRPQIKHEKEIIRKPKTKVRPKVNEEEEEDEMIEKPKVKSHHHDVESRVPNGKSTSHRPSSTTNAQKTTKPTQKPSTTPHTNTKRRSTQPSPSPVESDADKASVASASSARMIKPSSSSSKSIKKPSATEQKRTRTVSPNAKRSHHRTDPSPSSRPTVKTTTLHHPTRKHPRHETSTKTRKSSTHTKRPKKDHHTRILEMSDEV